MRDAAVAHEAPGKGRLALELQIHRITQTVKDRSDGVSLEIINGHFYWRNKKQIEALNSKNDTKAITNSTATKKDQPKTKARDSTGGQDIGFKLVDINFRAKKNEITFVVGKVGSGKSSLLMAMVGEMGFDLNAGSKIVKDGTLSFITQKPWVMNTTLKENILMGMPYDEDRFQEALKFSCLDTDLKTFPKGIENETGENGDALSGGQRARLSLAQALYQDTEIYVFDDILSALDSYVGAFIMEQTIMEKLKSKTVIFSTHALQYLRFCHKIYLLEDGRIAKEGSFSTMVNYHAMGQFIRGRGGVYLATSQRQLNLKTVALLLGGDADYFADTLLDFRERVDTFGPYDYYTLINHLRVAVQQNLSMDGCMELLRLSHFDPQIFLEFNRILLENAASLNDTARAEMQVALERIWDNFFPLGKDLPFEIARMYLAIRRPREALRYNEISLQMFGEHPVTYCNMGICHYHAEDYAEARRYFARSLALNPDYGLPKAWLARVNAEQERLTP